MTKEETESTPVARDEVGEVGPMLRTADDLRQYEREGVRLDGSMGFAWWVDGDWITATDQYFSSKALIEDYGFVLVSFDPHLTPQPDGDLRDHQIRDWGTWDECETQPDVREALLRALDNARFSSDPFAPVDAVLTSGLVVPVGEVPRRLAEVDAVAQTGATKRTVAAEAQVAAVRRELERWDGYGHGEFNIHMPEHLPCSACNLMAAIRAEMDAALDAASASPTTDQRHFAPYGSHQALCGEEVPKAYPWDVKTGEHGGPRFTVHRDKTSCLRCRSLMTPTTDQRIEARHLTGEHVGREVVLPDGTRGEVVSVRSPASLKVEGGVPFRHLEADDVVTLIGGEE